MSEYYSPRVVEVSAPVFVGAPVTLDGEKVGEVMVAEVRDGHLITTISYTKALPVRIDGISYFSGEKP